MACCYVNATKRFISAGGPHKIEAKKNIPSNISPKLDKKPEDSVKPIAFSTASPYSSKVQT
jgi:hypothetical protein